MSHLVHIHPRSLSSNNSFHPIGTLLIIVSEVYGKFANGSFYPITSQNPEVVLGNTD